MSTNKKLSTNKTFKKKRLKQKRSKLAKKPQKLPLYHPHININNNGMPNRTILSQKVLEQARNQSQKVLKRKNEQYAKKIVKMSKTFAKMSEDPDVQEKFATMVVKVGSALAVVLENGGDVFSALVKEFAPAARTITLASSDLVQDTLVNAGLGVVGTVPVVGDVAEAVGEEFNDANESFWRSFMAIFKVFPDVINIIQKGVNDTSEAMKMTDDVIVSLNDLIQAINNVSENLETHSSKKISGGKRKNKTKKRKRHRKKH